MQRDGRYSPYDPYGMGGYPFDSGAGPYFGYGTPGPSAIDASLEHHEFPRPLNDVEFEPSETCPKNFVIFDQTYSKSRVMFHPSLAQKFGSSSFNVYDNYTHEAGKGAYRDNCEDSEDIDALLSSEEACQDDDDDDDVLSTGRTPVSWGGNSPDPTYSYPEGTKSTKSVASAGKKVTPGDAGNSERKRERMKKMVKTLKGIVPGGDRMDTPAVLDEAVRYLKSLKVEAKKLGLRKSDS